MLIFMFRSLKIQKSAWICIDGATKYDKIHCDCCSLGLMVLSGVIKSTVVPQLQVKKETVQDLYDDGSNMEEARKLMEKARRKRHRKGT